MNEKKKRELEEKCNSIKENFKIILSSKYNDFFSILAKKINEISKRGNVSTGISISYDSIIEEETVAIVAEQLFTYLQIEFSEKGWIQIAYYNTCKKTIVIIDFEPFWVDYIQGSGLPFNPNPNMN